MLSLILNSADVTRNLEALTLLEELRAALISRPSIPVTAQLLSIGPRAGLNLLNPEGKLLAVLDPEPLTLLRTSLVAALAADALAPPEAKRVAMLGGGPLASSTLKALRLVRSLREAWLVTTEPEQAWGEANALQHTLKTPVRAVDRVADAVANADLVVLTGGVDLPEVALWPSVHLSLPAANRFDAAPVTAGVLANAWRVSDGEGPSWGQPVHAQLGAVLAPGAARPAGRSTLFLGAGPAWLDLVAAWHVYQGALGDETLARVDFGA